MNQKVRNDQLILVNLALLIDKSSLRASGSPLQVTSRIGGGQPFSTTFSELGYSSPARIFQILETKSNSISIDLVSVPRLVRNK